MTTPITITGRIGQVELRWTSNGKAVLNGSVAVDREKYNKDTRQYEKVGTDWHRFDLWGAKAEAAAEVLNAGTLVVVAGSLESRDYETRDGDKRTVWEVHAQEVGVIPMATKGGGQSGGFTSQAALTPKDDPWATPTSGGDEPPW